MKKVLVLIATLLSTPAFADGWVCESQAKGLKVKVYNMTQPEIGTRNAAVMILSDMTVQEGRKTIATFKSTDALLVNDGARYTAEVDLRYSESSRKGELIAGTKLGELDQVKLKVAFSYNEPIAAGEEAAGRVTLVKRDGDTISFPVVCERYLKN